jgi:ATP-dependent Clp protease adapter protein ClpS
MGFIQVLQQFFAKTEQVAHAIMLKIHIDGESVCGIYSYDVAQTKMSQVVDFSLVYSLNLILMGLKLGLKNF